MKKRTPNLLALYFLSMLSPLAFAEWLDNDALYRLEVSSHLKGQTFMLDLRNKILPCPLDKGITVYTPDGNAAAYSISKDYSRIIFRSLQGNNSAYQIYFGFSQKHPSENWPQEVLGKISRNELSFSLRRLKILNENKYIGSQQALQQLVKLVYEPREDMLALQRLHEDMRSINHQMWQIRTQKEPDEKEELEKRRTQLEQQQKQLQESIAELEKGLDPEDLAEGHHRSIWTESHPAPNSTDNGVRLTQDMVANIPTDEHFAAQFDGRISIDNEGIYEFAINSNDSSILYIDGKPLVSKSGRGRRDDSWRNTASLTLQPGLHNISLHVIGSPRDIFAEAAWKKNGETTFHVLEERDFASALPVRITKCTDRAGKNIPVISYEHNGHFVLDEAKRYDWISCRVEDSQEISDPVWLADKTPISTSHSCCFLTVPDSEQVLSLSSASGSFDDIVIQIPEQPPESNRFYPEIEMKLWTPPFIYDDEILDMDYELVSGLPRSGDVILKITASRNVQFISEKTECITLKGRDLSSNERFAPPSRVKHNVSIIGEELKDGLEISLYLMIPPVIFSQHNIRFLPLRQCAGINDSLDGLVDSKGSRVIPLLHRPTLAEKRAWALPKKFLTDMASTKKLLLIADDFGHGDESFKNSLDTMLQTKKTSLEFVTWKHPQIKSAMLSSIGKLIPKILGTDADRILLIPPAEDVSLGMPIRTQKRVLAALVEAARANKNIRTIQIASPFPSLRRTELDSILADSIRRMTADYNAEFLDINSFMRKKPGWRSSYRFEQDNDVLYEPYPVHYTSETARFISDSL